MMTTPIVEKIGKLEQLIIEGKGTLVDDNGKPVPVADGIRKGNPFSKVGEVVVSESEDEVFEPNDPMDSYFSSAGGQADEIWSTNILTLNFILRRHSQRSPKIL